ncbi:hypothetical protein Naga_100429g2 [Nannochloropsis gaditana]|uniref:Uncharacterized protein n=1 Tax=Nannochloropsis gaditana TaxID=72520 RepID=W7T364_9STRA|nr:hypothetical protein Naga_100429g2 [Nannochloropsis gaditana]
MPRRGPLLQRNALRTGRSPGRNPRFSPGQTQPSAPRSGCPVWLSYYQPQRLPLQDEDNYPNLTCSLSGSTSGYQVIGQTVRREAYQSLQQVRGESKSSQLRDGESQQGRIKNQGKSALRPCLTPNLGKLRLHRRGLLDVNSLDFVTVKLEKQERKGNNNGCHLISSLPPLKACKPLIESSRVPLRHLTPRQANCLSITTTQRFLTESSALQLEATGRQRSQALKSSSKASSRTQPITTLLSELQGLSRQLLSSMATRDTG